MAKWIAGVVGGLVVWVMLATGAGLILRAAWPDYVRVADSMEFTLSMKIARLAIGALATLAAGLVTSVISRSTAAAVTAGALLLLAFIPEHIALWTKFPVWYHLTFLLSLVPLSYLGASFFVWNASRRG